MRRMAASFEEPDRSLVLHLINSALTFRNLTIPKQTNRSLYLIPFLSHHNFHSSAEKWIKTLTHYHFHRVIPFHPPTCHVREAAHKTLRSRLYNTNNEKSTSPHTANRRRHDLQLSSHAHTPPRSRQRTSHRWTLRPYTTRHRAPTTPSALFASKHATKATRSKGHRY